MIDTTAYSTNNLPDWRDARIRELEQKLSETTLLLSERGECPNCKGSGETTATTQQHGPDDYEVTIACPECKGTGVVTSDNALVAQSLERSPGKREAEGSRSSECTQSVSPDKQDCISELRQWLVDNPALALEEDRSVTISIGALKQLLSATLPSEPPLGLLVSIALRLDHGLFMVNPLVAVDPRTRKRHIEVALSDARRAWEECNGKGFWSVERNAEYEAMLTESPYVGEKK